MFLYLLFVFITDLSIHISTILSFSRARRGVFIYELNFRGCGKLFLKTFPNDDVKVLSKFSEAWMIARQNLFLFWCPKGLCWLTTVFNFSFELLFIFNEKVSKCRIDLNANASYNANALNLSYLKF